MTVEELTNIFLRLEMADKAKDSEFLFGSSEEGVEPFPITGVILDDEGDVCLESDDRMEEACLQLSWRRPSRYTTETRPSILFTLTVKGRAHSSISRTEGQRTAVLKI